MPLVTATVGRVVFIRWPRVPTDEDIAAFDRTMADARRDVGAPLHHVALIQEGTELPAPPVQKALLKRVLRLQHQCATMHAILEGRGVLPALGRRFMRGMARMAGLKNAHVHANAEEALKAIPADADLGMPRGDITARARDSGVLG